MDLVQERAWVGTYKIGEKVVQTQKSFKFILDGSTHKLVKASRIKKLEYTDIGCIKRLRLPEVSEKSGVELELPVRVQLSGGRLSIISSRLLMFNRVAKVGSQSLIKLLFKLNDKNKFHVHVDQRAEEVMTDLEEYFLYYFRTTTLLPGNNISWRSQSQPSPDPRSGCDTSTSLILSLWVWLHQPGSTLSETL